MIFRPVGRLMLATTRLAAVFFAERRITRKRDAGKPHTVPPGTAPTAGVGALVLGVAATIAGKPLLPWLLTAAAALMALAFVAVAGELRAAWAANRHAKVLDYEEWWPERDIGDIAARYHPRSQTPMAPVGVGVAGAALSPTSPATR